MSQYRISVNNLESALLEVNETLSKEIILASIEETGAPVKTAGTLITDALTKIGLEWEKGNLALSQVYMSSLICERVINRILPPKEVADLNHPVIAIGVFEDFHLLGKRIVYSTLKSAGINVIDLGGGLTIETIVEEVKKKNIAILLLSVLMLPSALRIKDLKDQLSEYNVTVVVGGAPFRFDDQLSKSVGADYYGKDSAEALSIINSLIK